jgi:hypothetical protein
VSLLAGLVFAVFLVTFSWTVNRWLCGGELRCDRYLLTLTASAVFLLAVVLESLVNPAYETLFGHKLWEYRVLPLHDANVSALGAALWFAYGIHLYFTLQSLRLRLPEKLKGRPGRALVIGFEAPLFAEVTGNLIFLAIAGQYYAYYLPGDLLHLTSLQAVPVYAACVYLGLHILDRIEALPRRRWIPTGLLSAGVIVLFAG